MKRFYVTFTDVFKDNSIEGVYQQLLDYLEEVVTYEDISAFDIGEINHGS